MTLIFDFKWFFCVVISIHSSQSSSKSKHSNFRKASCLRNKESNDVPYLGLRDATLYAPVVTWDLTRGKALDNERLVTNDRTLSSWEITGLPKVRWDKCWIKILRKTMTLEWRETDPSHTWGYYWHSYTWSQVELISSHFHRFVPHFHLAQ